LNFSRYFFQRTANDSRSYECVRQVAVIAGIVCPSEAVKRFLCVSHKCNFCDYR